MWVLTHNKCVMQAGNHTLETHAMKGRFNGTDYVDLKSIECSLKTTTTNK